MSSYPQVDEINILLLVVVKYSVWVLKRGREREGKYS